MTLDPTRIEQPRLINPAIAAEDKPLLGELFSDLEQNTRLLGMHLRGFPVWAPWIGGNEYLGGSRENKFHYMISNSAPPTGFYGDGENLRAEVGWGRWAAIYPQESTDVWTSWPNANYPDFVYSCQAQMGASGGYPVRFAMGLLDHIQRGQNPVNSLGISGTIAFAISIHLEMWWGGNSPYTRMVCSTQTVFGALRSWWWFDSNVAVSMFSDGITAVHEYAIEILNSKVPRLINFYLDGDKIATIQSNIDNTTVNLGIWTDTDGPRRLIPFLGINSQSSTDLVVKATPRAIMTSAKES